MPTNLEIKARIRELSFTKSVCEQIQAKYIGLSKQTDTYFQVPRGRLKLRETENGHAELIRYEREENSEQRISNFEIYFCNIGSELKRLLSSALGVRAVVEKRRTLFLLEDTRIHLDEVKHLGTFLEFEVPCHSDLEKAQATMLFLIQKFGIRKEDYLLNSYVDLLENHLSKGE
jgi:adenylate cyclase class 2